MRCPRCGSSSMTRDVDGRTGVECLICDSCSTIFTKGQVEEYWDNHSKEEGISDYRQDYNGFIPVGCRACGGDYPNCKTSCPMFDD